MKMEIFACGKGCRFIHSEACKTLAASAGAERSGQILHDQGNKMLTFLLCPWNGKSSSCCMVSMDL